MSGGIPIPSTEWTSENLKKLDEIAKEVLLRFIGVEPLAATVRDSDRSEGSFVDLESTLTKYAYRQAQTFIKVGTEFKKKLANDEICLN